MPFFAELAAPLWIGPVNSDRKRCIQSGDACHGRIELAGGQSFAAARPWLQCDWLAECAGGTLPEPPHHGAGLWTSFADFSWRERSLR